MATLNLSSYSITNGSIIGYSSEAERFDVVGGDYTEATYTENAQITNKNGKWRVDLTTLGDLEGFTDVSGKSWQITVAGATTTDVELGSGADAVTLNDSKSETTVKTGDGKDTVKVAAGANGGSVDLGDGADEVVVADGATVSIAGGAGKDSIDVSAIEKGTKGGEVYLTDFDATEDVLVVGADLDGTVSGVFNADGSVKIGNNGQVKVAKADGSDTYAITYIGANNEKHEVAWSASTGSEAGTVDMSSSTKAVTMYGNDGVEDTLLGGTKNDTIHAGTTNYIYGGAGKDSIILSATENTQEKVELRAAGGKDTVENFQTVSSNTDGDVIALSENAISDGLNLKASGGALVAKQGAANVTLNGIVKGAETVINVEDSTGKNYTVDFVSGTATVSEVDAINGVYYADSSKKNNEIDFSTVDDSLVVDLGNTGLQTNTSDAIYYGKFASVKGGKDDTVLMGSADNKETLIAGTGATTLWGGSSKAGDLLVGNSDTENAVTFFYTDDNGKDTVKGARWGIDETADALYLSDVSISKIKSNGSTTTFTASTGNVLTVEGTKSDVAMKWTTDGVSYQYAKIGQDGKSNEWTYEEDVTMYVGGKNNSVKVKDDAEVWLAGDHGKTFNSVNKVDASSSYGTVVLAGNGSVNETLIGGMGDNSLWGGAGTSNDTLRGSTSGSSTFYFGKGEGNDVITNTSSDDKVLLYNVGLNDIASIDNSTSGQLKFKLTDGATLTVTGVSGSSVSQYQLSDGSTWTYDASSKSWSQNK